MEKSESLKDSKIYDKIENFGRVVKNDDELWAIFEPQIAKMHTIVEHPLKIAIMGEFKSGKSSFVNSLLGQPSLLPVGVIPKTATIRDKAILDQMEAAKQELTSVKDRLSTLVEEAFQSI